MKGDEEEELEVLPLLSSLKVCVHNYRWWEPALDVSAGDDGGGVAEIQ